VTIEKGAVARYCGIHLDIKKLMEPSTWLKTANKSGSSVTTLRHNTNSYVTWSRLHTYVAISKQTPCIFCILNVFNKDFSVHFHSYFM